MDAGSAGSKEAEPGRRRGGRSGERTPSRQCPGALSHGAEDKTAGSDVACRWWREGKEEQGKAGEDFQPASSPVHIPGQPPCPQARGTCPRTGLSQATGLDIQGPFTR